MSIKVAVLADDLSGGNSVGAEFARQGLATLVARVSEVDAAVRYGPEIIVVTTDTRNRSPEEADAITRDALTRAVTLQPAYLFKKLDSLLRGPIAVEAAATMAAAGADSALVVTASPPTGRTTRAGRQLVDGRPLLDVIAALDPGASLATDEVGSFFLACGRPLRHLDLDTVRAGEIKTGEWSGRITIADCETQSDLDRTVSAAIAADVRLFFGTYGMGASIARLLGRNAGMPVLVIAGSLSEATHRQVLALREEGECTLLSVDAPSTSEEARRALSAGRDVVLCARPDTLGPSAARLLAPPTRAAASAMEERIARCAEPLLGLVSGLIVSGGSTADTLLVLMGAHGLVLSGSELLPGVPVARILGGSHDGLRCVTKPGSFGTDDALCVARRFVRDRRMS
ncbi:four-carbon acid sugar kinase family protein [Methylobacterium nodulans]|uniref:Type III effector Hrp-dependent outers n=1 Tax=Methylobacterium nodulans (strain LMG 21967 / CNCM I-2342 / ORS 2060) TaxID=460265 RepID=B8IXF2_METNO|nr:four-carbon acid sugar kinase family protein [Methylobacterium nodulans]ACL63193.1 type III effector Hrp-dependent outers [Methylobacterium nodulans ORS 2060]